MPIKSVMILCVESQYTQEYIANVFWEQYIAKVSSITLIPYIKNLEIYNIAYITINEWCDSEIAYNFINSLDDSSKEVSIMYDYENDKWWSVQLNTHNNGDINGYDYTVKFNSEFYKINDENYMSESCSELDDETVSETCSELDETVSETSTELDEDLVNMIWPDNYDDNMSEMRALFNNNETHENEERPIKGMYNDYYTVDEALEQLHTLYEAFIGVFGEVEEDENIKILKEMEHFERELKIHEACINSNNVTVRSH